MMNFQALIGVVIGGVIALASAWGLERQRQVREARNLAMAFRGEIIALREIVKRRGYLKNLTETIEAIKRTSQPRILHIPVRRQYFNVFDKNVDKIGMLNAPLPELLATFYIQANAALEDMESIREGIFSGDSQSLAGVYESLHALLADTLSLGDKIIAEIPRQYSQL